ncbi:phage capsid protein [Acinetobacter sp. MB5]|uniref:non-contractile tail sheath protein n=1 Tax=Acinetobacter sp. MB5 TaxID=2069438 RepID=UPI000DD05EAD|nr:phage capsid protein [Acinetobacter sp. MB5]
MPNLQVNTVDLSRFHRNYWRVDGSPNMSFALTNIEDGFQVEFVARTNTDRLEIIWDSEDVKDHQFLSYATQRDYSNLIWEFDLELSENMPELNDPVFCPKLMVVYEDEGIQQTAEVALFNYADMSNLHSAHIYIDWNTLKSGLNADVTFPVTQIDQIYFSCICNNNEESSNSKVLITPKSGYLKITHSEVSGERAMLELKEVIVPIHEIGILTDYDEVYDLNPQRIVDNLLTLGYMGQINHDCGSGHYPEIVWNSQIEKFHTVDPLTTPSSVVNAPAMSWHRTYADALQKAGLEPIFRIGFEISAAVAIPEWLQREHDHTLGTTIDEPSRNFFSPTHQHAVAYLKQVFFEFAQVLQDTDCTVNMQIGEPCWWHNSDTLNPCVYDYHTRLAFHAETGLYAPDLGTIYMSLQKSGAPYDEFRAWLSNQLGQACLAIRNEIQTHFIGSTVSLLIDLASMNESIPNVLQEINLPVDQFMHPAFDTITVQTYAWTLHQPPQLNLVQSHIHDIVMQKLGFSADQVAYISGFVPTVSTAYLYEFDYTQPYQISIWQHMISTIKNNQKFGLGKQFICGYAQLMRDSITLNYSTEFSGFFAGDQYVEFIFGHLSYSKNILI